VQVRFLIVVLGRGALMVRLLLIDAVLEIRFARPVALVALVTFETECRL